MEALIGWLAPILSTLIVCAGQLALNARFKAADEKRDQARAETQAKREAEAEWRSKMSSDIQLIKDATQTNMRTNLCHLYEKYMTRGWLTSEEHRAWHDMHEKYSALGANSLIDSYAIRIDQLPHHEI